MNHTVVQYKARPLGEQLNVHLAQRPQLRRGIPLFSISFTKLAKCFEADTRRAGERLQRA